jgi:hypothetical protein
MYRFKWDSVTISSGDVITVTNVSSQDGKAISGSDFQPDGTAANVVTLK